MKSLILSVIFLSLVSKNETGLGAVMAPEKSAKRNLLVIDSDEGIHKYLTSEMDAAGYAVTSASTAEVALQFPNLADFDVILSELLISNADGTDLLAEFRTKFPEIPLILLTAYGTIETAIHGMRMGAFDYILKPINIDDLKLTIDKALRLRQLEKDNFVLRSELKQSWKHHNMIGKSRPIRAVFELIQRVAATQASVLITGESGTGKELVARALHEQSTRRDGPFIPINCSAIPGELLESELFGHVKGAFTGAHQAKKGLFEEAHKGTIFLDEIGDMEFALQAKLLRVIQERKVKPVGDNTFKTIDVRIIAATHKNLRVAAQNQEFREDLYYRLCVIPIELPPLRQRKEDIPLLAEAFLKRHATTHAMNISGFTADALAKLMSYHWPGNVRELENVIERSVILGRSDKITENDIPHFESAPSSSVTEPVVENQVTEMLSLEEVEKNYIELILRKTGGKKEKTAQILGIDRKTLRRKAKDYGLAEGKFLSDEVLLS